MVRQRGAAAGIQISASHNPYNWNGVKLKASYGSSASTSIVSQVEQELARVLRDGVPALPPRIDLIHSLDVRTPYLETLAGLVDWDRLRASKLRFLIDPMHGAGRGLLRELFRRQGIEAGEIRGNRDPLFGGVNPEPIEPNVEALRQALRAGGYDAGIALDGDADRIGTATEVISAIQAQNNVNPAGQIGAEPIPKGQQFTYTVRTQGRLVKPEEFGNIILRANPDGSILHLRDVARIELGDQQYGLFARYNQAPAGVMAIYQLPGSNAVETAAAVRTRMKELSGTFPPSITYSIPLDTTKAVTAGIREIVYTLLEALGLVVIVVFVFLQGWRATLIPLLAVPVSLIGTFIIFPALGFSINTLSLFGLVLAIGLVVDDAIIVVEAVEHHIEEGMDPKSATEKAMSEVGGPVVAIALILAAVFIPTAAIPGITGRLYQQFAVTIAISVLISAFNALTLSPALAALLLKPRTEEHKRGPLSWLFARFNRFFGKTTDNFVRLSNVLIHKSSIAMVALISLPSSLSLPVAAFPEVSFRPKIRAICSSPCSCPIALRPNVPTLAQQKITAALLKTPGIEGVIAVTDFSLLTQVQSTNSGFFFVALKPWEARKSKQEQLDYIQSNLQKHLFMDPDGIAFAFPPPSIPGLGTSGGVTMILEDRSGIDDPTTLTKNVFTFLGAISKRPEIAAAIPSYQPAVPQLYADVDREKALQQQVDLTNIYTTMQTFMGGYLVNYFNRFGRQWQTYVEAEGESRTSIDNINRFYVRSANGSQVPLGSLVHVKQITGPEFIYRFNEFNAAQINITGAPGYSSGQVRKALEEVFHQTMPSRRWIRLLRHVLSGRGGRKGRSFVGRLRTLALLRLPDSCCSL